MFYVRVEAKAVEDTPFPEILLLNYLKTKNLIAIFIFDNLPRLITRKLF